MCLRNFPKEIIGQGHRDIPTGGPLTAEKCRPRGVSQKIASLIVKIIFGWWDHARFLCVCLHASQYCPNFFFFYNKPVLLLKQERSKTVLFLKIKSFKTSETNRRPTCGSRRPQCDGSAYCPDCSASTTHDESLKKRVCRAPMTRRKPRPRPSPREVTSEPTVTLRWH